MAQRELRRKESRPESTCGQRYLTRQGGVSVEQGICDATLCVGGKRTGREAHAIRIVRLYAGAVSKVASVACRGWVEVAQRHVVDQKARKLGEPIGRLCLRSVVRRALADDSGEHVRSATEEALRHASRVRLVIILLERLPRRRKRIAVVDRSVDEGREHRFGLVALLRRALLRRRSLFRSQHSPAAVSQCAREQQQLQRRCHGAAEP